MAFLSIPRIGNALGNALGNAEINPRPATARNGKSSTLGRIAAPPRHRPGEAETGAKPFGDCGAAPNGLRAETIPQETPMLRVIAQDFIKPEALHLVHPLYAELTRQEPLCLGYELLVDQKDPGHFIFIESWPDRAARDRSQMLP